MSRPTSRRKAARVKRDCYVNAHQLAINRARVLNAKDVAMHSQVVDDAVREFCCGIRCAQRWRDLADISNMAESLAALRIGSGDQADQVIQSAQQTLAAVHQRQATKGTWTLYADEMDHLYWLAALHKKQIEVCSYGEFEDALQATQRRLQQARAGNAPRGAVIVEGLVGGPEPQP